MGRKHLQLNGVPGAPHPSPPQFSDGGLAPSAPRTPHGTKAQENKSKNAQHMCKTGSLHASTQKMEGWQE